MLAKNYNSLPEPEYHFQKMEHSSGAANNESRFSTEEVEPKEEIRKIGEIISEALTG